MQDRTLKAPTIWDVAESFNLRPSTRCRTVVQLASAGALLLLAACGPGGGGSGGGDVVPDIVPPPPAPEIRVDAPDLYAEPGKLIDLKPATSSAAEVLTFFSTGGPYLPSMPYLTFTMGAADVGHLFTPLLTQPIALEFKVSVIGYVGGAPATGSDTFTVHVAPVSHTGNIAGTVVDAATRNTVAGATVSAGTATATTAADGHYLLANVSSSGRLAVSVSKPGYLDQQNITHIVEDGQTAVLDMALSAPALVEVFSPTNAVTLSIPDSEVSVSVAPNSLQTLTGADPVGDVTASLTLATGESGVDSFPGDFVAQPAQSPQAHPFIKYGMQPLLLALASNIDMKDGAGNVLQLRAGQSVTLRMPNRFLGQAMMFYYDTQLASWVAINEVPLTPVGLTLEAALPRLGMVAQGSFTTPGLAYGCVVDAANLPVANAVVTLTAVHQLRQGMTNSRGEFSVFSSDSFMGSQYQVVAEKNGLRSVVEERSYSLFTPDLLPTCLVVR